MLQKEQIAPKVFISYSWTTTEHEDWVMMLANRLETDGVHVVIDKWELKRGQDKYHFMESSVKDPETTHVLLILDKGYAEKADKRSGGVGTETQIISPQIYDSVNQQKFIPIIRERDEDEQPYQPAFLKSRVYIDFSNDDQFEESYEELMRDLINKPSHRRPQRGTLPSYLFEEDNQATFKTSHLARGIETILNKRPERLKASVKEFLNEFHSTLATFKVTFDERSDLAIGKQIVESVNTYRTLRDDLILFFDTIFKSGHIIDVDQFISFYNNLFVYTESQTDESHINAQFDNYKIIIHELFLTVIALALKHEQFSLVEDLLHSSYSVKSTYTGSDFQTYRVFYFPISSIDAYYNHLKGANYIIPQATFLIERVSELAPKELLVEADLLCYHLSEINVIGNTDGILDSNWFPLTYIYERRLPLTIFRNLTSKRYFEKVKGIYAVNSPKELADKIESYKKENRPRVAYTSAGPVTPIFNLFDSSKIASHR